eukprot:gene12325-13598_t
MQNLSVHLLDLPTEDVLCKKILVYLTISEICRLKLVSKYSKHVSEVYFQICHSIDLSIHGSNGNFTGENFELITKDSQCLRELNLRRCKNWLQNKHLIPVLTRNLSLRQIDISSCLDVTNEAIKTIALNCRDIEVLIMQECRWLSPDALELIGKNCKSLKTLNLIGCWNISNESLCGVFESNRLLNHIDIGGCYGIDGETIKFMAKNCTRLKYVGIQGCWRVKNDAIFLLREYCKGMEELKVKDCAYITEGSLAMLRAHGVKIDVERIVGHQWQPYEFNGPLPMRQWPLYLQI